MNENANTAKQAESPKLESSGDVKCFLLLLLLDGHYFNTYIDHSPAVFMAKQKRDKTRITLMNSWVISRSDYELLSEAE